MCALMSCAPGIIQNRVKSQKELSQREISKNFDKKMKECKKQERNIVKLLLLGSGESGKSTIFKQMKLLHDKITEDDYVKVKPVIYSNVITSMGIILSNMGRLGIVLENPRHEEDKEIVLDVAHHDQNITELSAEVFISLLVLWTDEGVQQCYERRNEYQPADCAKYFLDKLRDLYVNDYVPSTQDLLYARMTTTSIVHLTLFLNDIELKIIDVGGQRTQRRKWIHYFDDVNSVIFVAAISDFNQMMREDNDCNRLLDSLSLFHHTVSLDYFKNADIILFLNKIDLFREKIESKKKMHKKRFSELVISIYTHPTCATDSNQVQKVLTTCEALIMTRNIKSTFCR